MNKPKRIVEITLLIVGCIGLMYLAKLGYDWVVDWCNWKWH